MPIKADLTGQRFGRLVALEESARKEGRIQWLCLCDCGNKTIAPVAKLRDGQYKSCGCLKASNVLTHNPHGEIETHGKSKTRTYRVWVDMKSRCTDRANRRFKDYGGRGISVYPEWRHSYAAFLRDVGERPASGLSLDRIDNDGNYEPGNVRWATPMEQAHNRRR